MIPRGNRDIEAAVQYLTWALEEIEKDGHARAALHARSALEELRSVQRSANRTDEHAVYAEASARGCRRSG